MFPLSFRSLRCLALDSCSRFWYANHLQGSLDTGLIVCYSGDCFCFCFCFLVILFDWLVDGLVLIFILFLVFLRQGVLVFSCYKEIP